MYGFGKRPIAKVSSVCEEPGAQSPQKQNNESTINTTLGENSLPSNSFVPKTLRFGQGETYESSCADDGLTQEEKQLAMGRLAKTGRTRTSEKQVDCKLQSSLRLIGQGKYSGTETQQTKTNFNYGWVCQAGFYPDDLNKKNQDNLLVETELAPMQFHKKEKIEEKEKEKSEETDEAVEINEKEYAIFGVFDGHGRYGTECSTFAASKFTKHFVELHHKICTLNEKNSEIGDTSGGYVTSQTIETALTDSLESVNVAMHKRKYNRNRIPFMDDTLSGTTAILVLAFQDELYVANVGDSRAIMASTDKNGKLKNKPLSADQTPFRKDERDRCKEAGAVVMTMDQIEGYRDYDPDNDDFGNEEEDGGDPPRLWYPQTGSPGVAFTRSLGDEYAEAIGCIATPEILRQKIHPNDKFIVIASDGVFEFLSSETVVEIVSKFECPHEAAKALVAEAYKLWLHYEIRTDDITAIVIYLNMEDDGHDINRMASDSSLGNERNAGSYKNMANLILQAEAKPVRREMSRAKRQLISASLELDEDETSGEMKIPVQEKTAEEIEEITDSIKANFLFQHLNSDQLKEVLDAFIKKEVEADEVVITQGEKGDCFYVVSQGTYDCFIEGEKDENGDSEKTLVHTYESREGENVGNPSFGELALMFSEPRAATIIARTDGSLWSLDRVTFRKVMIKRPNRDILQALKSVPIFLPLGKSQIQRLADAVSEKKYNDEDIIIRQGDLGDTLYIVSEGEVRCTIDEMARKEIQQREELRLKSGRHLREADASKGIEKPHPPNHEKPTKTSSLINGTYGKINFDPKAAREVMKIGKGGYFGEKALLQREPRAASVIAIGNVTCLCVNRQGFESILGPLADIIHSHSQRQQAEALAIAQMKLNRKLFGLETLSLKDIAQQNKLAGGENEEAGGGNEAVFSLGKTVAGQEEKIVTIKSFGRFKIVDQKLEYRTERDRSLLLLSALNDEEFRKPKKKTEAESSTSEMKNISSNKFSFVPNVLATFVGKENVHIVFGSKLVAPMHEFMANDFTEKSAAFAAVCILAGLKSLHTKHILCRSISPSTLMVDENGYVVLADLGGGKLLEDEGDRTFTICGDPAYFSPEQILNQGYGMEVDYWALGVFVFELLQSRLPFDNKDEETKGAAQYSKIADFDASSIVFENVSVEGQVFIRTLLEKNVKTRSMTSSNLIESGWISGQGIDKYKVKNGSAVSPLLEEANKHMERISQNEAVDGFDEEMSASDIPEECWFKGFVEF